MNERVEGALGAKTQKPILTETLSIQFFKILQVVGILLSQLHPHLRMFEIKLLHLLSSK